MTSFPHSSPVLLVLLVLLLAACEPDPLDDFRGGSETGAPCETGNGDGDTTSGDGDGDVTPVVVPHVCGGTDGVFLYLETDEACDAGYVHYCYVGAFSDVGIISLCCDPETALCSSVAFGSACGDGLQHVCDRV